MSAFATNFNNLFKPQNICMGDKAQDWAIALNESEKHPVLGTLGGRIVGVIAVPIARIGDVALHLILAIGKGVAGLTITPIAWTKNRLCNPKWRSMEYNWSVKQAVLHIGYGTCSAVKVFVSPIGNLLFSDKFLTKPKFLAPPPAAPIADDTLSLIACNTRAAAFEQQLIEATREINQLKEQVAQQLQGAQKIIREREQQIETLTEQIAQGKATILELQAQLEQLQPAVKQNDAELAHLREQFEQQTAKVVELQKELENSNSLVRMLEEGEQSRIEALTQAGVRIQLLEEQLARSSATPISQKNQILSALSSSVAGFANISITESEKDSALSWENMQIAHLESSIEKLETEIRILDQRMNLQKTALGEFAKIVTQDQIDQNEDLKFLLLLLEVTPLLSAEIEETRRQIEDEVVEMLATNTGPDITEQSVALLNECKIPSTPQSLMSKSFARSVVLGQQSSSSASAQEPVESAGFNDLTNRFRQLLGAPQQSADSSKKPERVQESDRPKHFNKKKDKFAGLAAQLLNRRAPDSGSSSSSSAPLSQDQIAIQKFQNRLSEIADNRVDVARRLKRIQELTERLKLYEELLDEEVEGDDAIDLIDQSSTSGMTASVCFGPGITSTPDAVTQELIAKRKKEAEQQLAQLQGSNR